MSRNYAIAIGMNEYYNLKSLRYARQDAAAMQDFWLQAQFDQVYFFAEGAAPIPTPVGPPLRAEPTVGNLERFFEVRFQDRFLDAADNLWCFFAGHGVRHQGRDYLMPLDGSPGNVERTAIAIRDLSDRLRRSGAGNIILLLDACRSEDNRRGEGIGREVQPGLVTIFACSPNKESYEIEALGQGAFTYALLEALRLQGEGNCATVERLDAYLRQRVPELNRWHGKPEQYPYAMVEPASKYHLILLPQAATLKDVEPLKLDAAEAELEGDYELAETFWIRVLAVSPADRQAIKAIKRLAVKMSGGQTQREPRPEIQPDSGRRVTPPVDVPTVEFTVVKVNAKGQELEPKTGRNECWVEDLGDGVQLTLVKIPEGSFLMGSPERELERWDAEGPQHQVSVRAFWMGQTPVTQEQWRVVAGWPQVERELKPDPSRFKGKRHPVEWVSWQDAVEFCQRLSRQTGREYSLPTEAEWEYACRAGTTTPFHLGETLTTDLANYDGNSIYGSGPKGQYRQATTEVGSFQVANAFGLYDMHGNVWEWCQDVWHNNYEGAPIDGRAWETGGNVSGRSVRGGSWYYNPGYCRSAFRLHTVPGARNHDIGFRVVCRAARTL